MTGSDVVRHLESLTEGLGHVVWIRVKVPGGGFGWLPVNVPPSAETETGDQSSFRQILIPGSTASQS